MDQTTHTAAAIIVAAGRGVRMQSPVAKQFLEIGKTPVIVHTLHVFATHPRISDIRLVVPEQDLDFCRSVILPWVPGEKKICMAAGGPLRQDSVCRGLEAIKRPGALVVIHDGVRPFVEPELIDACIEGAAEHGACIAGIPVAETLKRVKTGGVVTETLCRDGIWLAQTPQAFRYDLIRKAFDQAAADGFTGTDDASLVERLGWPVHIIEGSRRNIKITSPADLEMAACLLQNSRHKWA